MAINLSYKPQAESPPYKDSVAIAPYQGTKSYVAFAPLGEALASQGEYRTL